jgi:uncharacterized protein YrzB (UPF0473 family)
MAEEPETITLIDESGIERRFQLHDAFDLAEVHYYLVEAADDPSQVLLLREGADGLETIDGEEFKQVMAALEEDKVD